MFHLHPDHLSRALSLRLFELSVTAKRLTPGELRMHAGNILWCGALTTGKGLA
jgi:hypothetical protein